MVSEEHPLAAHWAALTRRAVVWAVDAFEQDDTTVSALARRLGLGWHTLWRAARVEAAALIAHPGRLDGVQALGVRRARLTARSVRRRPGRHRDG